jgi:hypothetical protein
MMEIPLLPLNHRNEDKRLLQILKNFFGFQKWGMLGKEK